MILLTGGAGFIGSVLAAALNSLGRKDIIIVDRFRSSQKWKNLRGVKYFDFIHADNFLNENFKNYINQIDLIFHLGAASSTTESDMDYLFKNNVVYSRTLFEIAAKKNIPFIYASSAATYGAGELGYSDELSQLCNLVPLNPYGQSKQLFDEWVLNQNCVPNIWFGLKFFNVFGPHEYHKDDMRSLVIKSHEQIKKSSKVKLFKSYKEGFRDGEQLRDFIYVKDVVNIILKLAQIKDSKLSGIYNVGTGQARSFLDLVKGVFRALKLVPQIEFIDMPEEIRNQYQYFTQADTTRLKQVIGEFKFHTLEEGIEDYILNFLETNDSYFMHSSANINSISGAT